MQEAVPEMHYCPAAAANRDVALEKSYDNVMLSAKESRDLLTWQWLRSFTRGQYLLCYFFIRLLPRFSSVIQEYTKNSRVKINILELLF